MGKKRYKISQLNQFFVEEGRTFFSPMSGRRYKKLLTEDRGPNFQ